MLEDKKQLVEQESQQLYSEAAGKFLADRFVTGTCPKCGYEVIAHTASQLFSWMNLLSFTQTAFRVMSQHQATEGSLSYAAIFVGSL